MTQRQHIGIGMTSARTRDRLIERLRAEGIVNEVVLERIRTTPRHLFVDEALASRASADTALPIGVGSGPANVLPSEWGRAWQGCRAGDVERMAEMQQIVEGFRSATEVAAGGRRTIACLKRALMLDGIISSAAVAPGTPALGAPDADRFDACYEAVREKVRAKLGPPWVTVVSRS